MSSTNSPSDKTRESSDQHTTRKNPDPRTPTKVRQPTDQNPARVHHHNEKHQDHHQEATLQESPSDVLVFLEGEEQGAVSIVQKSLSPVPVRKTGAIKKLDLKSVVKMGKKKGDSRRQDPCQESARKDRVNPPEEPGPSRINPEKPIIYPITKNTVAKEPKRTYAVKKPFKQECSYMNSTSICLDGINCKYVHDYTKMNLYLTTDYLVGKINEICLNQKSIMIALDSLVTSAKNQELMAGHSIRDTHHMPRARAGRTRQHRYDSRYEEEETIRRRSQSLTRGLSLIRRDQSSSSRQFSRPQ